MGQGSMNFHMIKTSSAIVCRFEQRSVRTKDYIVGMWCFSPEQTSPMSKSNYWLVRKVMSKSNYLLARKEKECVEELAP